MWPLGRGHQAPEVSPKPSEMVSQFGLHSKSLMDSEGCLDGMMQYGLVFDTRMCGSVTVDDW
jgi:hypothetical protein